MSAELLGCAPKSLTSLTLASPLILVEPIDVGRMLTRYFLKFILLSNEISSGFLRDISATELIAADPDNRLLPVLKWHLSYSIGDVQPVTYLVAVMAINDDVIPCDDRLSAAVYCKIYFELKMMFSEYDIAPIMEQIREKQHILIENYPDEFGPHKWSFDLDEWMAEEYHSGRPTYYSKAITEKREAELRELYGKRGQTNG